MRHHTSTAATKPLLAGGLSSLGLLEEASVHKPMKGEEGGTAWAVLAPKVLGHGAPMRARVLHPALGTRTFSALAGGSTHLCSGPPAAAA